MAHEKKRKKKIQMGSESRIESNFLKKWKTNTTKNKK